jgi:hypothetical protein
MRTPAGKECRHYYQDFHRGRSIQECRLIKYNPASLRWHPSDCSKCPVPDILNANASPHLELKLTAKAGFLGFNRQLEVESRCRGDVIPLEEAYTGCIENSPGLDLFRQALDQSDDE